MTAEMAEHPPCGIRRPWPQRKLAQLREQVTESPVETGHPEDASALDASPVSADSRTAAHKRPTLWMPVHLTHERLLTELPPGVDYTDDVADLDRDDIPKDRIPLLQQLMVDDQAPEDVQLRAALLLSSWGESQGARYLIRYVEHAGGASPGWFPHRLRNYDETYTHICWALARYWSSQEGVADQASAKADILPTLKKLVQLAGHESFELPLEYLVLTAGFTELIPDVKAMFLNILKQPERHHWKVEDTAKLLDQLARHPTYNRDDFGTLASRNSI